MHFHVYIFNSMISGYKNNYPTNENPLGIKDELVGLWTLTDLILVFLLNLRPSDWLVNEDDLCITFFRSSYAWCHTSVQFWQRGWSEERTEWAEETSENLVPFREWVRRRMSEQHRPAASLGTLSRRPPVKELCRRSASFAGSLTWILWTTATSTAHWRLQSAHGRSRLCGPNWTKGHSRRSTTRIKPARALG